MTDSSIHAAAQSGVFVRSQGLRRQADLHASLDQLTLQDVNEIRLLLRGESVVDWYRLDFGNEDEVRTLLALNSLSLEDPGDVARIESIRAQAAQYINKTLKLRLYEEVASTLPFVQLPVLASGEGKFRRHACLLLKVMHIIYHLDARELRTALAISDTQLFGLVEQSVVGMFDELRAAGVPVMEFSWSRKSRISLITKMLIKRQTSAARVFDRLRFRLVVKNHDELAPTLHVMLRRCIPFNYVVPGQTVNTLLPLQRLDALNLGPSRSVLPQEIKEPQLEPRNEFSGQSYRILNFIADLPVRVDELLQGNDLPPDRGRVVFVLAEFQIMDSETARDNERGESSHSAYKSRQHIRVKERLLRTPPHAKSGDGESEE